MQKRLALFLALLGTAMVIATYLVRLVLREPVMDLKTLLGTTLLVFWGYYLVGRLVSKVGLDMVRECLAERRVLQEAAASDAARPVGGDEESGTSTDAPDTESEKG